MFKSVMRVRVVAAGLVVGAASNLVLGATVSWGPVTTITANTDIVNPATVVEARNYGPPAADISVAVGSETVIFTPASGINVNNRLGGDVALFDPTGTSVTPEFDAVLDSEQWDNTAPGVMSFSGLTDAGSYTLQVFSSDDRDKTWKTTLTINGTSTTLDVTGKASVFATATIDLDPGETGFSVDVTYPSGSLWMVNAAVLADITPPPDPPTIAALNPADDATGVVGYANLSVTFSKNIQKGTGNITLKKSADNSTVETFDVATSPRITVSGATLTIDPTSILAGLTGYYVQIDATAVKDLADNAFAGIADTTTWNFTTEVADTTAPTIAALSPADNATVRIYAFGDNLVATFDENVQKGTGNITLKKSADSSTVETFDVATSPRITVSGATLTIDPTSNLAPNTGYYVEIASTAIQDFYENAFAGISGSTAWNFNAVFNPPTVSWGPVTTITANTDIVNPATVVEARNYGSDATSYSVNVGGQTVVFTNGPTLGAERSALTSTRFDTNGTTVTANFDAVLDSCEWANYGGPWKISFSGLTDGGNYTLQVFSSDDHDRTWYFDAGINGTSVHFDLTGNASLFATATIELGPGETSFDVDITNWNLWMVNAVVLADITPPPPPSGTVIIFR